MAYNRYLGGFGQPGALPMPGVPTVQGGPGVLPPPRWLGGFNRPGDVTVQGGPGIPGAQPGPVPRPTRSLGPPTPNLGQGSRYLGGFGRSGSSLPPRQGDGPETSVGSSRIEGPFRLPQRYLGPPIGTRVPGAGGPRPGPLPPPVTGPGSPGWQPGAHGAGRWVGAPQVAGEAAGRYLGPPARMNMVIDPRTGQRAVGAAATWASMFANGFRLPNDPTYNYTFEQADALRASALEALKTAPPDPFADPEWEAWLRAGAPLEDGRVPAMSRGALNSPFSEQYEYPNDPDIPWGPGFGEAGTQAQEDAYMDWLRRNGLLGWNE